MSLALEPTSPGSPRATWRDEYERISTLLEPYILTTPTGEQYINPHATPGPLAKAFDTLTQIGLRYGWLTTEEEA